MNKDEKTCECPECGTVEVIENELFGETYRVCANPDCNQEWFTDVDYTKPHKPSCSTCGDSGEDRTGENPDEVYPCPDCQEQKQPSDDEIKGFHKLGLLISGFFITKKIDSSTYDQLLKYLYEAESDYKSQQSRIDELQEKLKVAEDALNGDKDLLTSIVESLPFTEGEKQIKRIDSALSTIKGETE